MTNQMRMVQEADNRKQHSKQRSKRREMTYHSQVVRRGLAMLNSDKGICRRYVHHLEVDGAIDLDDLRGCGQGSKRRWFLA